MYAPYYLEAILLAKMQKQLPLALEYKSMASFQYWIGGLGPLPGSRIPSCMQATSHIGNHPGPHAEALHASASACMCDTAAS